MSSSLKYNCREKWEEFAVFVEEKCKNSYFFFWNALSLLAKKVKKS